MRGCQWRWKSQKKFVCEIFKDGNYGAISRQVRTRTSKQGLFEPSWLKELGRLPVEERTFAVRDSWPSTCFFQSNDTLV